MPNPLQNQELRAVLLNFEAISTADLQHAAQEVIPPAFRRRFNNEERRRAHWAGRAAVAQLLRRQGAHYQITPNSAFGYLELIDSNGKPAPLFCNISHTEKVAAAVIAPSPVGIDVERINRDATKVLKRVATVNERNQVKAYAAGVAHSNPGILLWSAKEAFSKALGLGMKFGFQKLEIDLSAGPPFRARTTLQGPLKVETPIVHARLVEEYLVTVCVDSKTEAAKTLEWTTLSTLDFTS